MKRALTVCPACGSSVPAGNFCTQCRYKLVTVCDCWVVKGKYNCGQIKCPGTRLFTDESNQIKSEGKIMSKIMSKIIKRKVGVIIPDEVGALMIFYPPAKDGCPFKLFHHVSMDELKDLDIRQDDVLSFEVKGPNQYKFLGAERAERYNDSCKCETDAKPVPIKPKELNMRERINLARSAITGLNLRCAKKIFNDAFLAAQEKVRIPAPEGSDIDGKKGADAGSCER